MNRDGMSASENAIWCSPEFTMSIKVGTEEDHALLMASIMRTCKHEDQAEFNKFAKEMRKKTVTRKDKDKELLTVDVGTSKTEGDDAETADGTTKDEDTKDKTEGKDGEEGKTNETVDDRIFVCLGKTTDGSEKRQIWIMTINRTFDEITFWEPKNHKHYVMRGRIEPDQSKYLEAYLSPTLTPEDREEIDRIREKQKAARETIGEVDEGEIDLGFGGQLADEDDDDDDDQNDEDDELKSDSDFQDQIERMINYSDMDQSLKGENINYIG
eukprot:GHVR01033723.1.p1 GENE.GHVR01033723.1~~GHVR01033723.1.p1  ORF type:complete len:270 (+),score=49.81 GHVR01033723.1:506-1315(+)